MNSNDQPPASGPLDFQPRRANDRVMLSRITNLEHEMAAVRMTVEVMRSNYVTKEDLARELGSLNSGMSARMDAIAGSLNEKIDKATANTHSLRAEMHEEFTRQTWRIVSFVTALCSALTAAVYYIARYVH